MKFVMKNKICLLLLISVLSISVFTGCNDKSSYNAKNNGGQATKNNYESNISTTEILETQPKTEPETLPISETSKTRIVMVGDVLLHTPVSDSGLMEDGTYNYEHLFKNVKNDIEGADLALVNQEVILGGTEIGLSGYPAFNGAYEVGDSIVNAGFDVVLHATNHALDRGKTGINNCINFWESRYPEIGVVGIYDSQEDQDNIYITEKNGIKIAILNYTYGTNGISMPADMPFAVNILDKDKIARDVEMAKNSADFIIACPHWGIEYTHTENGDQESMAKYFAELGVNMVIGTHPHVIQPIKWVEADNGNKALVYYSIGNFINATSEYGRGVADRMVGGIADFTIHKNEDGTVTVEDYGVIPTVTQMKTGRGLITTYKLSDYNTQLASENEIIERDNVFSYQYCVDLCNQVFGSDLIKDN